MDTRGRAIVEFHGYPDPRPESPHLCGFWRPSTPEIMIRGEGIDHRNSRKYSPQGTQPPKNGAFGHPSPEKPHLRIVFCPVMTHQSSFWSQKSGKTKALAASRRCSPAEFNFLQSSFRSMLAHRPIGSRKNSPLPHPHLRQRSRSRSLIVLNHLTDVLEPHHCGVPRILTNCPVKLHLTGRRSLLGKGLPRR